MSYGRPQLSPADFELAWALNSPSGWKCNPRAARIKAQCRKVLVDGWSIARTHEPIDWTLVFERPDGTVWPESESSKPSKKWLKEVATDVGRQLHGDFP